MTEKKRPYFPPQISRHESMEDLPEKLRSAVEEILKDQPALRVTMDKDRRATYFSEELAHLLGYRGRELVGKSIQSITAKEMVNLDFIFTRFGKFKEAQGLWLFEARQGDKLLCSYRIVRSPSEFTAEFAPLFEGLRGK